MSDAPETIWARPDPYEPDWTGDKTLRSKSHVEYRRADLAPMPPTPAQIMADPRVQALVDALERIAHASDVYGVEANAEDQGAETLAYAHKSTCNLARAALAQLKEPKP